jgi:hypothetical protein
VQLIINPTAVGWLSQILPNWSASSISRPQTLAEIKLEASHAGLELGQPFYFSSYPGMRKGQPGFDDLLLPLVKPNQNCANPTGCAEMVELRVYRPTHSPQTGSATGFKQISYELIDRVGVTGPEELAAIAPLAHTSAMTQGSTRILPFTQIEPINSAGGLAPAGIWFHLYGEWKRGSRLLYGQVMHYDPTRRQLASLQAWSSPTGQLPRWQQVTGSATAELVVDQSIGLEPQFQVYQLNLPRAAGQVVSLDAISLTEAARPDRAYGNALLLARHGLWSPALRLLQSLKQQGNWSTQAEAQLNLVALHAQVTRRQADRDWASPTQQILAQVIDGRWSQALNLIKAAHSSGYDVENLLQANGKRLWQRIETAMRLDPNQADLQIWGTLVLAVQHNRAEAIAWLHHYSPTAAKRAPQILAILEPLPNPGSMQSSLPTLAAPPVSSAVSLAGAADPTSALASAPAMIGAVTPALTVQPAEWTALEPKSVLALPPQQIWYRIDIAWQQGQDSNQNANQGADHWQTSDMQQLCTLLRTSPDLQIVAWQRATPAQPLTATVKALRLSSGKLSLLAIGKPLAALVQASQAPAIVAVTPSVSWAEPSASKTLTELAHEPVWQTKLIPQLWQDLQTAELIPKQASEPLSTIGDWTLQLMELTGDQTPEAILTVAPADPATAPRTIIFSQQGRILYSDLQLPNQALVAFAQVGGSAPVLILSRADGMRVEQWSNQQQQFEMLE